MASVAVSPIHAPLIAGDKTAGPGDRRHLRAPGAPRRRSGGGWPSCRRSRRCCWESPRSSYQIATGIGTWGLNRTVGWAFDITNFVFWVGIGHAGTLISAILFLFRQKWRTSVNRSAEAMTLFAVMCAGLFPVIHMGRPWLFYWIVPYPNTRGPAVGQLSARRWSGISSPSAPISPSRSCSGTSDSFPIWPRSATGCVPGCTAGWCRSSASAGTVRAAPGMRYEVVYLLLAGLATPLVVSVHSVVSADFAAALLPGWHTTIFPPYFVTGAIFSGLAMVLTLMLLARKTMHLEDYLTPRHIDAMTRLVLATSCLVGLAYAIEFFTRSVRRESL